MLPFPQQTTFLPKKESEFMPHFLASLSGEIHIKAPGTKEFFKKKVLENLLKRAEALRVRISCEWEGERLCVEVPEDDEVALKLLKTQFGISKVWKFLKLRDEELCEERFQELVPERPFVYFIQVERHLCGERFSEALEVKRRLLEFFKRKSSDLLKNWDNHPPERLEISLWKKEDFWCVAWDPVKGVGGLPVGVGEKVLALFSGGPDSLLAALLVARRGQEVSLAFMDDGVEERWRGVKRVAEMFASFMPEARAEVFRVPYREVLEFLKEKVPKRRLCLFCKSSMMRWAWEFARKNGFGGVVTGEIIGEQASQTLPVLRLTASAAKGFLLRPLLGFNKEEVFLKLREFGLEEAERVKVPSCEFVPEHPRTFAETDPRPFERLWPEVKRRIKTPEKLVLEAKT